VTQTHKYTAFMPMDDSRNIVHLKRHGGKSRFKFISFERVTFVEDGGFPVRGRDDIIVMPTRSTDESYIKYELSKLNGCSPNDIVIDLDFNVWLTVGRVPQEIDQASSV